MHPELPDFLTYVSSLGRGGMGEVVKALDTRSGQEVAVKCLFSFTEPEALLRQRQEAETLGALSHPNVVSLIDSCEFGGQHFLLIELLEGGDMYDFLKRSPGLAQILDVFSQDMPVMNGLEASRLLRAQGNQTPIVALTGHEREDWPAVAWKPA